MGLQTKDGYIPSATEVVKGHVMRSMAQKNIVQKKNLEAAKKVYQVWLSYDLGFDEVAEQLSEAEKAKKYTERYEALKPWLKANKALECGYSVATFQYIVDENADVMVELKKNMLEAFEKAKIQDLRGIRMYVVVTKRVKLGETYKNKYMRSKFLIGKRHDTNPWD